MKEARFYHLTRSSVLQALPELLEKTLAKGWRAVVKLRTAEERDALSSHLWAFRADSFLPHGYDKKDNALHHPLWLTTEDDNPNEAHVAFCINGAVFDKVSSFSLICDIFDGKNPEMTEAARQRWAQYKQDHFDLAYWYQEERGWTKKAK